MRLLLILIFITSCANIEPRYRYTIKEEVEPRKNVIQKLAECTEKYIAELGVMPSEALKVCEEIYRKR